MYSESSKGWLKHSDFIILDLISMQISYVLAFFMRYGISNPYESTMYRSQAFVLALCQLIVLISLNSFSNVLKRGMYVEFVCVLKYEFLVMACSLIFLYLSKLAVDYSRFVFIATAVIFLVLTTILRILWKKIILKSERENSRKRSIVLVSKSDIVETMIEKFLKQKCFPYTITGLIIIDKDMMGEKIYDIPVVGKKNDLTGYICYEWVDEVLIYLPTNETLSNEEVSEFLSVGTTVHSVIEKFDESEARRQCIEKICDFTVLTTSTNIVSNKMMFYKRCMDVFGGLIGCLITCILFIFLAPIIYIKSPGPIFFSQWRVGRNGRKFKIYKFRSMYLDAEERKSELMKDNKVKDNMMFKLDYDPRIIGSEKRGKDGKPKGIGNFIRRTSLDEFPQFFNVLKGDMSLVGTRPPTLDEWEKYAPHHRARMSIKPGITGAWQVSGRSKITDFEEVVKLDVDYIENWNNGLDIKIILKTILHVIKREGAM